MTADQRHQLLNLRVIRTSLRAALASTSSANHPRQIARAVDLLEAARRSATSQRVRDGVVALSEELDGLSRGMVDRSE